MGRKNIALAIIVIMLNFVACGSETLDNEQEKSENQTENRSENSLENQDNDESIFTYKNSNKDQLILDSLAYIMGKTILAENISSVEDLLPDGSYEGYRIYDDTEEGYLDIYTDAEETEYEDRIEINPNNAKLIFNKFTLPGDVEITGTVNITGSITKYNDGTIDVENIISTGNYINQSVLVTVSGTLHFIVMKNFSISGKSVVTDDCAGYIFGGKYQFDGIIQDIEELTKKVENNCTFTALFE